MNKLFYFLTIISVSLTSIVHAHLHNVSFEDAEVDSAKAAHWGVWGSQLSRVIDWSPKLDGQAMIAYRHWELSGDHLDSTGLFQDAHNISAGGTYEFTLAGFADQPDWGDLDGRIEIRLEATVDGRQVHLSKESVPFTSFLGDWRSITVRGQTPVDNLRAVVEFFPSASAQKGGAFKLDLTSLIHIEQ